MAFQDVPGYTPIQTICVLPLLRERTISNWATELYTNGALLREATVTITAHSKHENSAVYFRTAAFLNPHYLKGVANWPGVSTTLTSRIDLRKAKLIWHENTIINSVLPAEIKNALIPHPVLAIINIISIGLNINELRLGNIVSDLHFLTVTTDYPVNNNAPSSRTSSKPFCCCQVNLSICQAAELAQQRTVGPTPYPKDDQT
ncbi:hypothetical protein B0H10DRAFT_1960782 [Mycena sp. CBHHK59/15]|nr:hypothetical protein B0H10DRAFT_1960782 [Mycena sp. CBHHK59/15]